VGTKVTAADIALFASVHSYIVRDPSPLVLSRGLTDKCSQAGCTHSTLLSHPSLTRHFDHIQNLPLISSILARSSAFNPAVVPIAADNVPIVEVQIEIKAKKPKDVEAAAVVPEKVVEAVEEQKVAATEGGEKKPKKEKKAAAEGTKKAAPAAPVVEAPAPWMVDLRVGKIIDGELTSRAGGNVADQILGG
jgi:aminoacyl tRNA synthase complex-interacting multifunctional protein 1